MKRFQLKRVLALSLATVMAFGLVSCGKAAKKDDPEAIKMQGIIAEAEKLTNEELYKKAIEESNGKTMNGLGNSSRGKTAAEGFLKELKKIDPNYSGTLEWSQPKNNSIFTMIDADIKSSTHNISMVLIQDGNQIQSKELDTGNLLNFIPKDWKEAQGVDLKANGNPLALQTIIKVFEYNNLSGEPMLNCWDFVGKGVAPLFMGVNSEPVGKNFLFMLTREDYAAYMEDAFNALPADKKAYFEPIVKECAADAKALELPNANAAYSLAWAKLWCKQYNEKTDDGPICNDLVNKSAGGQSALIVYSKLRSVQESENASVKNVTVAAYQDGYKGIGGFGYKHYLQLPKTSPMPWTACAFIAYMSASKTGFDAWGKDIGGYCSNPTIMKDHSKAGEVDGKLAFPAKNDRGEAWWVGKDTGRLVIEDPAYCAKTSILMSDWVDKLVAGKR